MIADSTFRVVNRSRSRSNILPGIYRVILDAPELDVTCAVLLYSEASSPTKSKGGRARVTIERLRRPRKKPPARLVEPPRELRRLVGLSAQAGTVDCSASWR